MKNPKRLISQIHPLIIIPLRDHAEHLLREEIGFEEPKVRQIIQIVNHLKLSWELLSQEEVANKPQTQALIDFLFLNYFKQEITQIVHIVENLSPTLYKFPSYNKLQDALTGCREKLNTLALQDLNETYVQKIQ